MIINKVECLPLSLEIAPGKDALRELPCVLVKIHTDEGLVGIGDTGNLSAWYSGATQDSVISIISEIYAPLALIGQDPTQTEKLISHMDYLARDNSHALMAVDMALWDLKGKIFNLPLYQLLGGRNVDRISIGWVNADRSPSAIGDSARRSVDAGYTTLKVKVGQAGMTLADEVARVRAVREAVGPNIKLTIDANGGWSFEQAVASIEVLAAFDIGYVEQPLHHRDHDGLARLRRRISRIPIYADEAIMSVKDMLDLHRKEAIDGVFLKLCKTGGILGGLNWVNTAKSLHLPVICGVMSGSSFESAAYLHFMTAHSHIANRTHDCGPPRVLSVYSTDETPSREDIGAPVPLYRNGYGFVPEGPGLGVELNEELALSQITKGKTIVSVTSRAQGRHDGYRAKLADT